MAGVIFGFLAAPFMFVGGGGALAAGFGRLGRFGGLAPPIPALPVGGEGLGGGQRGQFILQLGRRFPPLVVAVEHAGVRLVGLLALAMTASALLVEFLSSVLHLVFQHPGTLGDAFLHHGGASSGRVHDVNDADEGGGGGGPRRRGQVVSCHGGVFVICE